MRRFVASLLLAVLATFVLAGSALAGARPWVPTMNSPPSPTEIQQHWSTPAQDQTPDKPWIVGYPYEKVPAHPLPADAAGGPG